ncbi:MAG: alpha/beta hydrolase [Pseudomonadota bacterium]|nr:alpha/beta hydrolase [Pseudomonadota bacterium]
MTEFRKVGLRTGVNLNVALAGDESAPAAILLHGFPESYRTWRDIAPRLSDRLRLIMPDQRGFAGSDRPREVDAYQSGKLVDDLFALADALGLESFALVGHDWGGAIAWAAALRGDPRLTRLAIVNAPHPVIFQKTLIANPDQRSASQYMNAFKAPGFAELVKANGFEWFFDKSFGDQFRRGLIPESEKRQYIAEWSQPGAFDAMLNWYRASKVVVPPPGIAVPIPDWVLGTVPKVAFPTLVVWAMVDHALLPVQLEGLDRLVDDLTVVRLPGVGHFAPWEAPEAVAEALAPFLAGGAAATGDGQ